MADQETQERDGAGSTDTTSSSTSTTQSGTTAGDSDQTAHDDQSEQNASEEQNEQTDTKSDTKKSDTGKSDTKKSDSDDSDTKDTDTEDSGDSKSDSGSDSGKDSGSDGSSDDAEESGDGDSDTRGTGKRSFLGRRKKGGGERPSRSINVSDLAWRGGSILATVVRAVSLLFAVVLVAHIALVVSGVINPSNGVASFLRGFADTVVLGFRDLFVPADPTIMLVVNYGVAAVFWGVLGVFLAAGIRALAARVS